MSLLEASWQAAEVGGGQAWLEKTLTKYQILSVHDAKTDRGRREWFILTSRRGVSLAVGGDERLVYLMGVKGRHRRSR
ncbi:hypothetical protein G3435_16550 [Pseudomonas sp. MAFF212428]|uniref:Uncharacterized protein n=1 Tax=Pseudomonas brassicae TaxID=2708063 RepID=A0A6M0D4R4_9PSED|nr:hypothetical protein [Pseudomonas brassicae]